MSISPRSTSSPLRVRNAIAVVTIFCSVVAPISILAWSIQQFIVTLPQASLFKETCWIDGEGNTLRDGELWFGCECDSILSRTSTSSLKKLNLDTLIEQTSDLPILDELHWPISIGNDLYLVTSTAIKKVVGNSIQLMGQRDKFAASNEFDFEGQMTVIRWTDDGAPRLFHLQDQEWIPGRRLRLPPPNSQWIADPQTGKPRLIAPRKDSTNDSTNSMRSFHCRGFRYENQAYLTLGCGGQSFVRAGFEFQDDDHERDTADATDSDDVYFGWEPIPKVVGDRDLSGFQIEGYDCDRDGFLVAMKNHEETIRVIRRQRNGTWVNVTGFEDRRFEFCRPRFLVDHQRPLTYLIAESFVDESYAVLIRIDVDRMVSQPIVLRSRLDHIFERWSRLVASVPTAIVVHWTIVFIGMLSLNRGFPRDALVESRGIELASWGRRGLSGIVDLALLAAIPAIEASVYFYDFHFIRNLSELFDMKWNFLQPMESGHFQYLGGTALARRIGEQIDERRELLGLFVATLLILTLIKAYFEGRSGATLGKALFGLRTSTTTGRPCGIPRALLRNLALGIDCLFLLSPLPLFISVAFSDRRQRCGDRLADTVVIRAANANVQNGS